MKKMMLLASVCLMLTSKTMAAHDASPQTSLQMALNTNLNQEDEATQNKPLKHKVKLANNKDSRVLITMQNSTVQVVGYNGDEVIIEAKDYEAPPARAQGLKPLYNQAEDNTGLGLAVTKENNTLKIVKASRQEGDYIIRVPKNAAVMYEETNWTGGDLNLSDMNGEIELKLNNGNATLTDVTGPVVANTTSSDLKIKFANLNQNKPSAISSVAGTVDVSLPASTKANFKLKTIQGEIYSDFDMNRQNSSKSDMPKVAGGGPIEATTNGGGVEMSLYTISGDMFIRKRK